MKNKYLFDINKRFIFARTNLNLQTQVTAMKKGKWEDEEDEYIKDEITLILLMLKEAPTNQRLSERAKQNLIDDCLDKLNTLYDEQRKRGTFKGDSGAA
jgi:hypothetical protein